MSDDMISRSISESRWQKGIATIGDHKLECERTRTLDGYAYRYHDQEIDSVDAFEQIEYMDWRDS